MDQFLQAAIEEARKGLAEGGIPIGSVLVCDGKIIGRGHNQRVQHGSVIHHAEMNCLENAGRLTAKVYSLCILYSTLSPCPMCRGAALLYKITRIVVGENKTFQGPEELRLPEPDQFLALVKAVRSTGNGYSPWCGDAVEFFAYAGPRLNEAAKIYGRDCSFLKNEITIRGDLITGTKNWEIRRVPMIPEMRKLLERLKAERGEQEFLNNPVLKVRKFQRSLTNCCKQLGLFHLTHHDLRHLFATRCIESGVDIPTVAKWLGHKDGGVLAMQTYGHLRDKHSANMAEKVIFGEVATPNVVPPPKPNQPVLAASANLNKTAAQAKAAYSYPWWASENPIEVFWGQANEPVQIVPLPKFLQSAKTAMGREVFEQELTEPQGLLDELAERVGASIIESKPSMSAASGMEYASRSSLAFFRDCSVI